MTSSSEWSSKIKLEANDGGSSHIKAVVFPFLHFYSIHSGEVMLSPRYILKILVSCPKRKLILGKYVFGSLVLLSKIDNTLLKVSVLSICETFPPEVIANIQFRR